MGTGDTIENAAEDLKGKVKEGVGKATSDQTLEADGRMDQAKASVKKAGDDVKDAFS
jgi:uncharacterized protein YjbJ (UPF0337 family)